MENSIVELERKGLRYKDGDLWGLLCVDDQKTIGTYKCYLQKHSKGKNRVISSSSLLDYLYQSLPGELNEQFKGYLESDFANPEEIYLVPGGGLQANSEVSNFICSSTQGITLSTIGNFNLGYKTHTLVFNFVNNQRIPKLSSIFEEKQSEGLAWRTMIALPYLEFIDSIHRVLEIEEEKYCDEALENLRDRIVIGEWRPELKVAGILVELVRFSDGFYLSPYFIKKLGKLLEEFKVSLIIDEVMTGYRCTLKTPTGVETMGPPVLLCKHPYFYGGICNPDYVTIGKWAQIGAIVIY